MAIALACLVGFVLVPSSAPAATNYGHVGEFGDPGSASGEFSDDPAAQRMAIHADSGKILIADRGNHRIQVFSPTTAGADFDLAFGDSATIDNPIGVAVDQDTGDVYVTAAGTTNAIVKFNPDDGADPTAYTVDTSFTSPPQGTGTGEIGAFQSNDDEKPSGGGIAVDPTTGDILVADPGKDLIQRFDSDGSYLDQFNGCSGGILCSDRQPFAGVYDVAVNSAGDIIVADVDTSQSEGRVDRFDPDGNLVATLSEGNDPVPNRLLSFDNHGIVVGVNPGTDEVFVSSVTSSGFNSETSRVYQFEGDEHVNDFAAPANFAGPLYGIAVSGTQPSRLYVMAGHSAFNPALRVQAFEEVVPPTVSIDPPSGVTPTEATFTGTVNPEDSETTWHFEYRPQGSGDWTQIPEPSGNAGDGTEDVSVDATAAGLEPNTEYEVRLHADGASPETTEPEPFTTQPGAPFVTTGTGSFLSTGGATLTGQINPRNSETGYRFEWGSDTDYGNVVPVSDASAGDGGSRVIVTEELGDLDAETPYHFRLVAENEFGQETDGEDASFTTLAAPRGGLGPEREWELVSQLPTGGIAVDMSGFAAEDGGRALYSTSGTNPHPPGYELPHNTFLAERGENGWGTEAVDLPNPAVVTLSPPGVSASVDLVRPVAGSTIGHDPDDQNGVRDLYQHSPDGGLTWITRSELVEPGEPQADDAQVSRAGNPSASAVSSDGRTVVFLSERRLLEEDPHDSGDPSRLYKWSDGELSLASVRPDGTVATGVTLGSPDSSQNAVSRDGSRVFWRDGTTIYAQIDGSDPLEIGAGTYVGATPDGSRVFFYAGGSLHAFEVDSQASNDLTGPAGVLGAAAVADEGSRVYFVATEDLEAEPSPLGEEPTEGGHNLYLVELDGDGTAIHTRFIATLDASEDVNVWRDAWNVKPATASDDGTVLAFGSVVGLTGEPTGGTRQLYVYDDHAGSLICASCPGDGSLPVDEHVNTGVTPSGSSRSGTGGWQSFAGDKRLVSPNGTVFFETRTALLQKDQNEMRDVYEYRDGELRLVTRGGPDDQQATIFGASADGSTVFFTSQDTLVPRDNEQGTRKVYAARVGGGFRLPAPTPGCIGDGCQGSPAPSPEIEEPQTRTPATGEAATERPERCGRLVASVRQRNAIARRVAYRAIRHMKRAKAQWLAGNDRRRLVRRTRQARRQALQARQAAVQSRRAAVRCLRGER